MLMLRCVLHTCALVVWLQMTKKPEILEELQAAKARDDHVVVLLGRQHIEDFLLCEPIATQAMLQGKSISGSANVIESVFFTLVSIFLFPAKASSRTCWITRAMSACE